MPVRFALSAEEAGLLIAKLPVLETVEFARQTRTGDGQNSTNPVAMGSLQKVFRAYPRPDGSVQMIVDYEVDGEGGKDPPTEKEAVSTAAPFRVLGEPWFLTATIRFIAERTVRSCSDDRRIPGDQFYYSVFYSPLGRLEHDDGPLDSAIVFGRKDTIPSQLRYHW